MISEKNLVLSRLIKSNLSLSKLTAEDIAVLKIIDKATGGGVIPVYDADITNGIASFSGVTASQPLVSLKLNIPVTQQGSGTPSPTNIRDIIPVSGVTIGQTSGYGKYFRGLLNGTYGFVDLGSLTWDGGATTGTPYRFNAKLPLLKTQVTSVVGNLLTKDYTSVSYDDSGSMDKIICGYTAAAGQKIRIQDYSYIGLTSEQFKTAMQGKYLIYELDEPSTPVTPEQFAMLCQAFGITGNTYQITFGQTVYSANLDVLTGKLYATHEYQTYNGSEDWRISSTGNNYFLEVGMNYMVADTIIANEFENLHRVPTVNFIGIYNSARFIQLRPSTEELDVQAWKTWLNSNNLKVVYKLAEPIEIDITPTVINTLIGENVIFADVANVTECKYTRK